MIAFRNTLSSLALLALALSAGCASETRTPSHERPAAPPTSASYAGHWTRVQDGRCFRVEDDGLSVTGALERDPRGAIRDHRFALRRTGSELVGTAQLDDGHAKVETQWRLHPEGDGLVGDNEYCDLDPVTGAVVGRGHERQEFRIERAPKADAAELEKLRKGADAASQDEDERARELAKLREAADAETATAEDGDAQRRALQAAADKEAEDADREEAERERLRKTADSSSSNGH